MYGNGRSEDNGDTWIGMGYYGMVAGYSDNSIGQLFAATTNFGSGIQRSTDFGATWEQVNAGIPTNDARSITVGPDDHLYVGAFHGSLYKTVMPTTISTAIDGETERPEGFRLDQNYPNPFNPSTTIRFALPRTSDVSLRLYDVLGRQVAEIVRGTMAAGNHQVSFDASDLPSGAYLYRLEAGVHLHTRTMVLLR